MANLGYLAKEALIKLGFQRQNIQGGHTMKKHIPYIKRRCSTVDYSRSSASSSLLGSVMQLQ